MDVSSFLVPTYISQIPQNPNVTGNGSGYSIAINENNQKLSVQAEVAELDRSVAINPVDLWSPSEISTEIWLDASNQSSLTTTQGSDTSVYQWNDKSGNDRHITQSNSDLRPTSTAEGVYFDGDNDFLESDLDFLANSDHKAYIVTRPISNFSNFYGAANGASGSNSLHVGFRDSISEYRINYWSNDFYPSVSSNYVPGESNLLGFQWNQGVGKTITANGSVEGSNSEAGSIGTMSGGGRIVCATESYHACMEVVIQEIVFITDTNITSDNDERITGYLAHKWNIEDKLPSGHPFRLSPPSGWTPSEISTDLWLDSSDTSTVLTDGNGLSLISEWRDLSGNDRHAVQLNLSDRPKLQQEEVYFNGDFFDIDLDFLAGATSHSAFTVIQPGSTLSNIYGATNGNSGIESLHVGFLNSGTYRINTWENDYEPSITSNLRPSEYNILQFEWSQSNGRSIWANAFLEGNTGSSGMIGTMSGGGRLFGVASSFHGYTEATLKEFIILTDGELTQENYDRVHGYLAHKWGLESLLPSAHPYRNEAPN